FDGQNIEYGIICSVLASIGYSGSLVFYNSFLPEIATYDRYDRISARGFSYGYIGSVILLVFNLLMIEKPGWFGLEAGTLPAKISFLTVGLWWIGFSQITFKYLPAGVSKNRVLKEYIFKGYREVRIVLKSLEELPSLKKFLLSFFFYNTGVQTVMYLAASFGDKELKLSAGKLIGTILIIQIVAILGSYLFARLSEARGNKFSINTMVIIWVLICVSAYFVGNENEFYALAFAVGLVMGGIQALSRATYAKLIPSNTIDHASYFSFYDVTYNVSIVLGTLSYGLIEHWTGSMRNSTLALGGFFLIGLVFLLKVRIPKSEKEAYTISEAA
ncbi:MAG: MFS transporter, partial [Bacteroidetes bacterium]|nr:MFS transporter [Bacteroidota bacterium]